MNDCIDILDEETSLQAWVLPNGQFPATFVLYSNWGRKKPAAVLKHNFSEHRLSSSKHDEFSDTDCIHYTRGITGALLPDGVRFTDLDSSIDDLKLAIPFRSLAPGGPLKMDSYPASFIAGFISVDDDSDWEFEAPPESRGDLEKLGVKVRRLKAAKGSTMKFRTNLSGGSWEYTYVVARIEYDPDTYRVTFICPSHPEWAEYGYPQVGRRISSLSFGANDGYAVLPFLTRIQESMFDENGSLVTREWYLTQQFSEDWGVMYMDDVWSYNGLYPFSCRIEEGPHTYFEGLKSLYSPAFLQKWRTTKGRITVGMPSLVKKNLTKNCLRNFQYFSINSIAYLEDIWKLKRSLKPLIDLRRKPLSPKTWANLWLAYRYGIRLFISDSLEIAKAWQRERKMDWRKLYHTVRSREEKGRTPIGSQAYDKSYHMKVYVYPDDLSNFEKIYYYLRRVDLWPSLENVWDLIPFSFVVDWFIPIDKYLKDIDRSVDSVLFRAKKVLFSVKSVLKEGTLFAESGICVHLYSKSYHRWHENRIPFWNSLTDHALGQGLNDSIHVIDAVSLAIQRRR